MSKTVNEIVREYLEKNGCYGLTEIETGCFCSHGDLMNGPCALGCQAAYYNQGEISTEKPIEGEPASEQNGLPVRIAVAVDSETLEWNAEGLNIKGAESRGENIMDHVAIDLGRNVQYFWIEAVIPITEPPVIVGTVEKEEE